MDENDNVLLELRKSLNMTQERFAKRFGIPISTLRKWEQGVSEPPDYVYMLIRDELVSKDSLNMATVKFINMLDIVAAATKRKFIPFSTVKEHVDTQANIIFDDDREEDGAFPVILATCVGPEHHDVISYYDSPYNFEARAGIDEIKIRAFPYDEDGPYIEVTVTKFFGGEKDIIVIEDGRWYFA